MLYLQEDQRFIEKIFLAFQLLIMKQQQQSQVN
jgi:hypothetical protein